MRAVGLAARCYELMLDRSIKRETFGKRLCQHGGCQEMIADSRADLEMARLLTLSCASAIDNVGANGARDQIGLIKYAVPELAFRIIDRSVQVRIHCYFVVLTTFCAVYSYLGLQLYGWSSNSIQYGAATVTATAPLHA